MAFDPRCPYWLNLDCFDDVPESERPALQYRRVNGAEYAEIAKARALEGSRPDEEADALYAALRVGLIDWRNWVDPASGDAVAFDPNDMGRIIDPIEAVELINKRLYSARVSPKELKNSELPS